jgi:Lon protease-like protein
MILPLHIFEERYREMVRDALQTDRVLALAQLEPGWESQYGDRPRLRPLCCAATIVWNQGLPDGRFNIIVQGIVRTRILEELPPTKGYREVRADMLRDPPFQGEEEEQLRQAVFELGGRIPQELSESLLKTAAHSNGGELADIVAATVVSDIERRQELLCELDVKHRLTAVLEEVGELIGRMVPSTPQGPLN